ncbi:MAG: SpoIID/LytB domain-containing protein [Oscillospiraceae bacterium]
MNNTIHKIITCATAVLALSVFLKAGMSAEAAGEIYVNDGQSILGGSISSAYAIGGDGSVSPVGDSYVVSGSGVTKLGVAPDPGGDDGTTVKIKTETVRVGLNYYFSSRDSSLPSANLQNKVGSGYQFGYYDAGRNFNSLGGTTENKITMTPDGAGQGVKVTQTDTGRVLYVHGGGNGTKLAVRPVSNGGKAETWFKGHSYYGDFEYFRYINERLTVVNILNVEDYIKGVITREMSPSWPIEALKAQALCARSYFYQGLGSTYTKYGFDLTADTNSQAYLGTDIQSANSNAAVDATAGQYITYNGRVIEALYSSSSGGATEDSENVWGNMVPYLRGVQDPYHEEIPESMNSYKSWQREFTGEQLAAKVGLSGAVVSAIPEYSRSGNCIKITFTDAAGASAVVERDGGCRTKMGLPSIHYTVQKIGDNFVFEGGGWGHNLGMSQFGAYAMAKNHGMNANQIIKFYFTGVGISKGVL